MTISGRIRFSPLAGGPAYVLTSHFIRGSMIALASRACNRFNAKKVGGRWEEVPNLKTCE